MNQCPQCKNYVDPKMNICPFCGFDLRSYYDNPYQYQSVNFPQVPPGSYSSPSSYPQSTQATSSTSDLDLPFYFGISGTVVGVISLCTWILPICGCPLSLIGIGISAYGITSKNKTFGFIGLGLNTLGFILSIISGIIGGLSALTGN